MRGIFEDIHKQIGAQLFFELRACLFWKRKTYICRTLVTREFRFAKIRALSALQASLSQALRISERRNRTRACYARRAAPTSNQKPPIAMNDYRGFLVSHSKPILNRKPPFDASIIPYCRHITKRADLSDRFLCRADRLYEFSAILFPQ